MRLSWDKYFMALAKLAALRSGCNSRPTGAVIVKNKRVIATGYNGSLPGKNQCTDLSPNFCLRRSKLTDDKGQSKYQDCPSIHAEQNALNQLSINGQKACGSVIYTTLQPCIFCLKNIASNGIFEAVYELEYESDDPERDKFWRSQATEYGVILRQVKLTDREAEAVKNIIFKDTSERRLK